MMPGIYAVDALHSSFVAQLLCQFLSNAVHTAHCRHNPYLIAYTYITILALIAFECAVLFLDGKFFANGIVSIFERARQIGLQIILVHPITRFQILTSMTDGVTVFYDVITFLHILNENFMTSWCVLIQDYCFVINGNDFTFFLWLQADDDAVCRINFQKCSLFHLLVICLVCF